MDFSESTHHCQTCLDQRMQPYFDNVIICCSACSVQLACVVGKSLLKYFVYFTTTTRSSFSHFSSSFLKGCNTVFRNSSSFPLHMQRLFVNT